MKNYISDSFKNIATIFWILIAVILWYQVQNHVTLEEAILITTFLFLAILLVNTYISVFLLPKALKEKKMNTFWICFILSILVQASVMAILLLGFNRLEELSFFLLPVYFRERIHFGATLKIKFLQV